MDSVPTFAKSIIGLTPFLEIIATHQIESVASKLSFLMADQEDSNNHLPCKVSHAMVTLTTVGFLFWFECAGVEPGCYLS